MHGYSFSVRLLIWYMRTTAAHIVLRSTGKQRVLNILDTLHLTRNNRKLAIDMFLEKPLHVVPDNSHRSALPVSPAAPSFPRALPLGHVPVCVMLPHRLVHQTLSVTAVVFNIKVYVRIFRVVGRCDATTSLTVKNNFALLTCVVLERILSLNLLFFSDCSCSSYSESAV